ncbi:MAG TPA: nucleotidyltransferase family protein [Actinomycetota bacterium]|nr:nucleotidyltransferase family protein [Actinomycetota bacterium]
MRESDRASHVLRPENTLDEAMRALQSNREGVAVVVDGDDRMLGTVIDADIRRATLNDISLSAPVTAVMSRNPVRAESGATKSELLDLMRLHRLRAIPIVDDEVLVDVRSLTSVVEDEILPVTVIMAGGEGRRLRPLTETVPKPLVPIGDRPVVEGVIGPLRRAGVKDITLALNYKAELIQEHLGTGERLGVSLRYMIEKERMGTAGALSLLPETPDRPICVSNADIVTTMSFARLFDYHWHHRAAITVAATWHTSAIPYGVLRTAGHYMLGMIEKPEQRELVSGGIYVLDPEVLRFIRGRAPLDMPDLVADVLAEGLPVCVFPILETWVDIGRIEDLERARAALQLSEED